ncbi:MAG: hypothetical protein JJ863_29315 [Deltaproteobacteria bacterium]|nr:hypothetical protein [Deltaproteobacteria bacterium]
MEMSLGYMVETVEALATKGYVVERAEEPYADDGSVVGHLFTLTKPEVELRLETVVHAEDGERYFLEIKSYHGLWSHSFELDSWKHRPDRIEFKYQPRPDGTGGLAFTLVFDEA